MEDTVVPIVRIEVEKRGDGVHGDTRVAGEGLSEDNEGRCLQGERGDPVLETVHPRTGHAHPSLRSSGRRLTCVS